MSNASIREKSAAQTVRSKYFTSKSAMDESLSDFQEPKKIAGPKKTTKAKPDKPKKAPKRIRGQKDIRTALQTKKNELESYARDFDNVCKHAGLDIDSEQLQLAIALSKSLHQPVSTSGDSSEPSQSSSQDRVRKIRTTLLEYGFKVPEIKIATTRRIKRRKHYKLLQTSEEAKKQIVSDKHSQVLFENITFTKNFESNKTNFSLIQLYHLATNETYYSRLKNNNTFYVDGLLEKSTSTGNLLRDWSEIPGRPVSPRIGEPDTMNFSEIECSQDELDIILSGSIKSCKNVIRSKEKEISVSDYKSFQHRKQVGTNNLDNSSIILIDEENPKPYNHYETLKAEEIETMNLEVLKNSSETLNHTVVEIIDLDKPLETVNRYRSGSPDLFDDEPSTVEDNTKIVSEDKTLSSQAVSKTVSVNNVVMDLTEYEECYSNYSNPNSHLSQNTNVTRRLLDCDMEITDCVKVQHFDIKTLTSQDITKRKSNDLMEITNCVANVIQPFPIEDDIDLTQSPESKVTTISEANETGKVEIFSNNMNSSESVDNYTNIENYIRNENSNEKLSIENLPERIAAIGKNNIERRESLLVVNNNNYTNDNKGDKSIESLDLTQSSNTSDELPFVSIHTNQRKNDELNQSVDKTILIDPQEYETMSKSADLQYNDKYLNLTQNIEQTNHSLQEAQNNVTEHNLIQEALNNSIDLDSAHSSENIKYSEEILDLTQEIVKISRNNSRTSKTNESFSENDDFHNVTSSNTQIAQVYKGCNIDLTQNFESSEQLVRDYSTRSEHNIIENEADSDNTIEMEIGNGSLSDIDLTQNSESEDLSQDLQNKDPISIYNSSINQEDEASSDATIVIETIKSSQRCSSLGKKDDVSVDYDEVYDNLVNNYSNSHQNGILSMSADNNSINVSNKTKGLSDCSQNSEVFVISDNELDYSLLKSKLERPVDNFMFGGLSIMDELSGLGSFRKSTNIENNSAEANKNHEATENIIEIQDNNHLVSKTPVKHKRVHELATPQKPSCSGISTVMTPSDNEYNIKTIAVTPMPNYEAMTLEDIHKQLDNYGVKPFKRKRAIQLLTHIYNQTHPTIEPYSDEESPCKRRKTSDYYSPQKDSPKKLTPRKILSPKKFVKSPRKASEKEKIIVKASKASNKRLNDVEVIQSGSQNYEVNEKPVIKEIECCPDDWVFQKREKAKVHSCRVPLHIAFHNYVSSRRGLQEVILCYEPINIDDIHKDLVTYGHRYDPKDLLKFMDKKCITVKTTDNDARNHRK